MRIEERIDQILQGDVDLFADIIESHQKDIFTFCYFILGNREEAEDATQEVFIKVYRNLGSYRHEREPLFRSWLYKIASNYCNSLLRRKKLWYRFMPLLRNDNNTKSAEQIFSEKLDLHQLWFKELTISEKEMLVLRIIEDRSFEEISQILGISLSASRKRFERLKKKLNQNKTLWEVSRYGKRYES